MNRTDKLVNIIIVFSRILFEAAHVMPDTDIQNKRGNQAREWNFVSVTAFHIRVMTHPVIINVIRE